MGKKKHLTGLLSAVFLILIAACASSQQLSERQQQTAREIAEAVSSRHIKMGVNYMHTQRYGAHRVTSDFFLSIQGDTLISYLPFLGRAYNPTYNTPSQGLNFTSPISNYRQSRLKHDGMRMEMEVASQEDRFFFRVDVYPNGRASIFVRPRERDAINFDGEVIPE